MKTLTDNVRLDTYLVQHGYVSGREKAKERIAAGEVAVNGTVIRKSSFAVPPDAVVVCSEPTVSYVGRGALKLEKALQVAALSPKDAIAMDIGASTGGFTQCLLLHGARTVYAVDVGRGQLHPLLQADPRVVNLEGTDVRSERLQETVPMESVSFLTMDVSFISVRQVLPHVARYLSDDARLVILIKPQFEAGKADVGKNGIVKDKRVHVRVLREMTEFFAAQGYRTEHLMASPITGGAGRARGNIEYLAVLSRGDAGQPSDIRNLVEETFTSFSTEV